MKIRRSLSVVAIVLAALIGRVPGGAQAAPMAETCTSVAGTVYWHNASSWSCTPGGVARLPTIDDDVVISSNTDLMMITDPTIGRANSVTVNGRLVLGSNVTLVVFNDLIISASGKLEGGTADTTVQMTWGNLTVQPGGTLTPGNTAWLWTAPSVHTISGSPTLASLNVFAGAMLDLGTGNLTVNGTVTNNGIISATRTIGAAGAYTFGLAGGPINTASVSLNVNTGHAFTSITIGRHDGNHPNRSGADATKGAGWGTYWTITPVGTGTVDVTLPTTFTPDANDKVCRYTGTGTTWDCARTTNTSNTITRDGVTTFSDWAAGNEVGPNAVTLNSLDAKAAPDNSTAGWLLALLGGLVISGLWLARKFARR